MKNPNALNKIQESQKSLASSQGGTCCEGTSMDAHAKHEAPRKESGHGSASSGGVSGTCIPGGNDSKKSVGTGGY